MLVATNIAVGARTRNGSARRACTGPATIRTVIAMAGTAAQPAPTISAAAGTGPCRPAWSSAHSTITGSGGWPLTCSG